MPAPLLQDQTAARCRMRQVPQDKVPGRKAQDQIHLRIREPVTHRVNTNALLGTSAAIEPKIWVVVAPERYKD